MHTMLLQSTAQQIPEQDLFKQMFIGALHNSDNHTYNLSEVS